jgi:hypothetical protein
LHNADGICFFDNEKNLSGTVINRVDGRKIYPPFLWRVYPQKMQDIRKGLKIYRNFDYEFNRKLTGTAAERKIGLSIILRETLKGFSLAGKDDDGNESTVEIAGPKQPAEKKETARQTIIIHLGKLGDTVFDCSDVRIKTKDVYFLPVSKLNSARRELIKQLLEMRIKNRPRSAGVTLKNNVEYPHKHLTYLGNVLNKKAEAFYRKHGVETIEPAAESGLDMSGRLVMSTKYCLREELGLCPRNDSKQSAQPLILVDEDQMQYKIEFLCGKCGMEIFFGR